ncbi:MAG: hypothetical protein LUC26_06385 [Prevotella sp.]|nr:hypothetical protein [Prevotella sp.]
MPINDKEREEQIKNEAGADLFAEFDTTEIIGDIDFSVAEKRDKNDELKLFDDRKEYFLWAEAKAGTKCDITESFVQLILTIGKQREYEHRLPLMHFEVRFSCFISIPCFVDTN